MLAASCSSPTAAAAAATARAIGWWPTCSATSGLATLLFDLLTRAEEAVDLRTRHLRFDIALLAERLLIATDWIAESRPTPPVCRRLRSARAPAPPPRSSRRPSGPTPCAPSSRAAAGPTSPATPSRSCGRRRLLIVGEPRPRGARHEPGCARPACAARWRSRSCRARRTCSRNQERSTRSPVWPPTGSPVASPRRRAGGETSHDRYLVSLSRWRPRS